MTSEPDTGEFMVDVRAIFGDRVDDMSEDALGLLRELWDTGRQRLLETDVVIRRQQDQARMIAEMGISREAMLHEMGAATPAALKASKAMEQMEKSLATMGTSMMQVVDDATKKMITAGKKLRVSDSDFRIGPGGNGGQAKPKEKKPEEMVVGTVSDFMKKVDDSYKRED